MRGHRGGGPHALGTYIVGQVLLRSPGQLLPTVIQRSPGTNFILTLNRSLYSSSLTLKPVFLSLSSFCQELSLLVRAQDLNLGSGRLGGMPVDPVEPPAHILPVLDL